MISRVRIYHATIQSTLLLPKLLLKVGQSLAFHIELSQLVSDGKHGAHKGCSILRNGSTGCNSEDAVFREMLDASANKKLIVIAVRLQ